MVAVFGLLTSLLVAAARAQIPASDAETALNVLQAWYDESNGMWNTCGWWNAANCMTVIADLALVDPSVKNTAVAVFANTWANGPSANPGVGLEKVMVNGVPTTIYPPNWPNHQNSSFRQEQAAAGTSAWLDGAYDDDDWWAHAWIAAYDVTGNQDYLNLAIGIFDTLAAVWPTPCGGGIYWDHTHTYVNAISNELFVSLAAHLANRVSSNGTYLDWAQKSWSWFSASGLINSGYTINDGLTTSCTNNGQTPWSYNQGVILGGLVELYKATSDQSLLDEAGKIATAAINLLADSNHVIHESCEPDDCDGNQTQFKGIFIRNLKALQSVAPNALYVTVINANANSIWANDKNAGYQFGVDWAQYLTPVTAATHSSALDALVAAISPSVTGETIEVQFFVNECYGDVLAQLQLGPSTGCSVFPSSAHFVETGDGCAQGHCMVMEYYRDSACSNLGYSQTVGSGCYNINAGFGPVAYQAACLPC